MDGTLQPDERRLRIVSLFSGIGGGDLGFERAGHRVVEMCEVWDPARSVLNERFPGIEVNDDVQTYTPTVEYDVLSAGFPCVDLSHAGGQQGIFGPQSGLVEHVFRIAAETRPGWIFIENVPNLLRLHKGAGIRFIVDRLEELGYVWAYRVLDSRSFGVPQRRNRVVLLASLNGDPAAVLLGADADARERIEPSLEKASASGFYWTEGRRGVGLVAGASPTLKGGSTVGAPSAPAIWRPAASNGERIVLPTIEDAEVLQGFDRGWTANADEGTRRNSRWKLVGNAITVGLTKWVGERLGARTVERPELAPAVPIDSILRWPEAAAGGGGLVHKSEASKLPLGIKSPDLDTILDPALLRPLSHRATLGFLSRVEESGIQLPKDFMKDLEAHLAIMRSREEAQPTGSGTASWATSPATSERMRRIKGKNTTPEQQLRQALSRRGIRYRLQTRPEPDLRWRSDLVFRGPKLVVEVHGCFWHVCPIHQSWPKSNAERWAEKLRKNQERDRRMELELQARGWTVFVVWEHEDADSAAGKIEALLSELRDPAPGPRHVAVAG